MCSFARRAIRGLGVQSWRSGQALWMSAAAIALLGLYRGAAAVLIDAGGNFVNDLLNTWVGRIGEWLILAGVMAAHALHVRRKNAASAQTPMITLQQRHALEFTTRSAWLQRRAARRSTQSRLCSLIDDRRNARHFPKPRAAD